MLQSAKIPSGPGVACEAAVPGKSGVPSRTSVSRRRAVSSPTLPRCRERQSQSERSDKSTVSHGDILRPIQFCWFRLSFVLSLLCVRPGVEDW